MKIMTKQIPKSDGTNLAFRADRRNSRKFIVGMLLMLLLLSSCSDHHTIPHLGDDISSEADSVPGRALDGFDHVFTPNNSCIRLYDNMIYFWPSGENNFFYRFNPMTGSLSSVCADPLCAGDECIFAYGSEQWLVEDGKVYFITGTSERTAEISDGQRHTKEIRKFSFLRYDIENQRVKKIFDIPDDGSRYILHEILSDGYLYYSVFRPVHADNPTGEKIRLLCRTLPDSFGKTEEILYTYEQTEDGYSNLQDIDEQYYYYHTGIGESNRVTRVDRITGESAILNFPYYYINTARAGDFCYYLNCSGEPVEIRQTMDGRGAPMTDESGKPVTVAFYRLYYTKRNLLTGEEEILGEVPERINAYPLMEGNITDHYLYLTFSDGLWQCDHDGNPLRMVQTPEQKAANPVSGYRWILICDKWILYLGNTAFSAYDMETGEYTFYEFME